MEIRSAIFAAASSCIAGMACEWASSVIPMVAWPRRSHSSLRQRPRAPETIVLPKVSLAEYGPPTSTAEVALAPTWEVDR